jgi:Spo0E like sporulation regulatory protein
VVLMSVNTDSVYLGMLLEQIKIARNRMQQLWNEKGHTDAEVLIASIEVDRLMNEYQRVTGFLMQEQKKCLAGGRES